MILITDIWPFKSLYFKKYMPGGTWSVWLCCRPMKKLVTIIFPRTSKISYSVLGRLEYIIISSEFVGLGCMNTAARFQISVSIVPVNRICSSWLQSGVGTYTVLWSRPLNAICSLELFGRWVMPLEWVLWVTVDSCCACMSLAAFPCGSIIFCPNIEKLVKTMKITTIGHLRDKRRLYEWIDLNFFISIGLLVTRQFPTPPFRMAIYNKFLFFQLVRWK